MGKRMKMAHHYTDIAAFYGMIEHLVNKEREGEEVNTAKSLRFHASDVFFMNDTMECELLCENFTNNLTGGQKHLFERVMDEGRRIFAVSFTGKADHIPMWYAYGNKDFGICLDFNRSELVEEFGCRDGANECSSDFRECQYLTDKRIEDKARELSEQIAARCSEISAENCEGCETAEMKKILQESAFCKCKAFEYEHEWRIVETENSNVKYKIGRLGLTPYTEIDVPLSTLRSITIGPLANERLIRRSLEIIKSDIGADFDISTSTAKLQ